MRIKIISTQPIQPTITHMYYQPMDNATIPATKEPTIAPIGATTVIIVIISGNLSLGTN